MGSVKTIVSPLAFLILLSPLKVQGQDMPDSLIFELERTYNKERRLEILWEIVRRTVKTPNHDTTIYFAKQHLDLSETFGSKKKYEDAIWVIGLSYKRKGDFNFASPYLFKALHLYEQLGDKMKVGVVLYNIGHVFKAGNDVENALFYLQKALKQYQEVGDSLRQAFANYEIARCYLSTADYGTSLFHLEQCLLLNPHPVDLSFTSKVYNCIGINYYNLKSYDKSIDSYKKAKEYAKGLKDYNKKSAITYNNIGEVYVGKKEYGKALSHYEQALALKRQIGDKEFLAGTLINLGKLALLENRPSEAICYLEEIICILDKDRLSNTLKEASVLLSEAYKSKQILTAKDLQKIMALNEQYAQHIHDLKQAGFQQSMVSTISKSMLESEAMYLKEKAEKTRDSSLWIIGFSLIIIVGFLMLLYYRERKFKLFIQKMWEDIKDV